MKPETIQALRRMCAEIDIPVNTYVNRLIVRAIARFKARRKSA